MAGDQVARILGVEVPLESRLAEVSQLACDRRHGRGERDGRGDPREASSPRRSRPPQRPRPQRTAPASPPTKPDQVFFGLTRGQSFGPPKWRPVKYAATSVVQTTANIQSTPTRPSVRPIPDDRRHEDDHGSVGEPGSGPEPVAPVADEDGSGKDRRDRCEGEGRSGRLRKVQPRQQRQRRAEHDLDRKPGLDPRGVDPLHQDRDPGDEPQQGEEPSAVISQEQAWRARARRPRRSGSRVRWQAIAAVGQERSLRP